MENINIVYMVECCDRSIYKGWTNDLQKRLELHNQGKGAKYTKARLPVKLIYQETFPTKQEAMAREYEIKKKKRKDKLMLVEEYQSKIKRTH